MIQVKASNRLMAVKADEDMARKYIHRYAGVNANDLKFIPNSWHPHGNITFEMPSTQVFFEAVKNLQKHFGKPIDSSTTYNRQFTWRIDSEKSIYVAQYDTENHKNVIVLRDNRELTPEQQEQEVLRKNAILYPENQPTSPITFKSRYSKRRR